MLGGFELDYTSALNMFAEYGLRKVAHMEVKNWMADPDLVEVLKKYSSYNELKEADVIDQWAELQGDKIWKTIINSLTTNRAV